MTELVEKAEAVAARAYAPYSNYLVGAVVRTNDGREFEGVNVENAAYPLGVCAEKSAIVAAVTAGYGPGDRRDRDHRLAVRRLPPVARRVPDPRGQLPARRRHDRDVRGEGPPARDLGLPGAVKSGFVAVAGRPNVGKSTLVNALVGEKIAITSAVPNTTRRRIFGVANGDDYQLVLVDLPGFQKPMDKLTERMQKTVDTSFEDIDVVLFVLSARDRIGGGDRFIARRVYGLGMPVIVAVNKVDNLKPSHIITQMKAAAQLGDFHALHPVSAKTKDGIDELRDDLVYLLPEGQPFFPREAATDQTSEERISELIREKALQLTRDEVPHSISVEIDELDEKLLRAFVLVETESQKQILVGKKGSMIREIGARARPEIEPLLGQKIFLELVVKVRPGGGATTPRSSGSGSSYSISKPSCASVSVSIATSFACAFSGPASSLTGQARLRFQRITSWRCSSSSLIETSQRWTFPSRAAFHQL